MNSIEPGLRRLAQVIHLCDRVDVYNENNYRPERLPALLRKEAGRQFDPELVELFLQLDEQCRFITLPFEKWKADYQEIALWIDRDKMQRYLEMVVFAIDFKSSFTVTHSVTTRTISTELAKLWGMDEQTIYDIWIGSLLHDVGKLYVETAIVEAPGRLTPEEMEQMRRQQREIKDGVQLATMHSSKGLEYERVFILDAAEGITPYKKAVLDADLEEERRMFYVAMTRAKKELTVCYAKKQFSHELKPSRFIRELRGEETEAAAGKARKNPLENEMSRIRRK